MTHLPPLIHPDADPWLVGPMPDPDCVIWSTATGSAPPAAVGCSCVPVPADPINPERRGGAA